MIGNSGSSRRGFLKVAGGAAAAAWIAKAAQPSPWDEVDRILARIKAPVFRKRDFVVTKFGAVGDGKVDCSDAIAKAIAECAKSGGGRVVIPAGTFFTGPVRLKSKVNLHVSEGATLLFSNDPKRYLPVVYGRWEGVELLNYSPLIYADGEENIAVTGKGTLDGQADCEHWWPWKGRRNCGWQPGVARQDASRNRLFDMGARDVPVEQRVFGEGHYLRPNLFGPVRSKNVMIEGVTIKNSPMFEISPLLCTNVIVRNISIVSHGPNNDGCDPDSCTDVLIENCVFDTGDDCIAIKAGRNRDGRRMAKPSENIVIRGCRMKDGHGGITIGSEMSGGVRNVFAEDCRLDSPELNQALRFKTNAVRGGTIEHIHFRNIEIGQVSDAVLQIDFHYEEGEDGPERPVVRDIDIRNVTCKKSKYALQVRGFRNAPIRDLRLTDCTFDNIAKENIIEHVEGLACANVKINGAEFSGRG